MSFFTGRQSGSEKRTHLKILVVDDDLMSQHLMQVLLTREGYQVDVASNGLDAFDIIKYQKFDIVFMDLQMPVMDGIEASRRIRAWESDGQYTFIVALTASYLPNQGRELSEAGIDSYISKPFQVEHIQRILRHRAEAFFLPPAQNPPPGKSLDT